MKSHYQRLVTSILAQRKRLIAMQIGGKNKATCLQYIQELSIQVEAYKNKWNDEGWRNFIKRNLNKLEYLIPENKAGETIKSKLWATQK
jgi:hypothetical protein